MKPKLELIERTPNNVVYHLYLDIGDLDTYDRARMVDRFLKTESKIMEKVLESEIRHFLQVYGIIPSDTSESALKLAFDTLKDKGKQIDIIDRNKKAIGDEIVGVSENGMTVIVDRYYVISIAMEVRVVDL